MHAVVCVFLMQYQYLFLFEIRIILRTGIL